MADAADRDLQPDTAGPHRPSAAPTLGGASGGATWNSFRGAMSHWPTRSIRSAAILMVTDGSALKLIA
jgi:hypothetical protein